MKQLKLSEIGVLFKTKIPTRSDVIINKVSNNIRDLEDNALTFHIKKAESLSLKKLEQLSNCYIVTDQPLLKGMAASNKFIFVKNVNTAYKKLCDYYRNLFDIPVIAVTGTCGKTTTKEMIAQILRKNHRVVATKSSKNALRFMNDYLFEIDEKTEYAVFETAITHPGHLTLECEMFKPTIGVITTIGIDHLNWCRTLENYIRTKGELLIGLGNKGTLLINADDRNIRKLDFSLFKGKIVSFGVKKRADFKAEDITYSEGGMKFKLSYHNQKHEVFVPGYGYHNVYNALAALGVLVQLGKDLKTSIKFLAEVEHIRSHNELKKGKNNSLIIDDTWSSNPTSTAAALEVLEDLGKNKTKIAALGQISYLGRYAERYYEKIAETVIDHRVDILITKDQASRLIGEFAIKKGMKKEQVIFCNSENGFKEEILKRLNEKTIILFKCSMLDKSSQEVLDAIQA